jgi:cysteine desulfurase family protein (TIGR01976 family)
MPTMTRPSIDQIRAEFPSLAKGTIFMENAGGSQVPRVVADAIRDFMLSKYVQLGATYEVSKEATDVVARARDFLNTYVNGTGGGRIMFGASSSQVCKMLADAYADILQPGDEVIVAETGHEANASPWVKLEKRGFRVTWWKVNPASLRCEMEELSRLLSPRTKLVAFPQTSNLMGDIVDARAIADLVHGAGARVVVDGVAYAPHRAIDVRSWDADWYVYSTYKVFGPHMAVLYGKHEAFAEVRGPGHFFLADDAPGKFELGCPNYEGIAGILALWEYLQFLAGRSSESSSRELVEDAWCTWPTSSYLSKRS